MVTNYEPNPKIKNMYEIEITSDKNPISNVEIAILPKTVVLINEKVLPNKF